MQNDQFSKVKISLLELEKDFIDLKDRELKNLKEKIKVFNLNYFMSQLLYLNMIWINLKNNKSRK